MTCFPACWLFLLHWVCLCPWFSPLCLILPIYRLLVWLSTYLPFTCLATDCLLLRAETASFRLSKQLYWGFPGGSVLKNPPASAGDAGDMGLIPGLERSPQEKQGNPLQYSCLDSNGQRSLAGCSSQGHTGSSAAGPGMQEVSQETVLSIQFSVSLGLLVLFVLVSLFPDRG